MLGIHVSGHRNVHRRMKAAVKHDWKCSCGSFNRYYWVKCPVCSNPRPE